MTFPKYFLEMLEPLQALQRLITRFEERGVVIGGMAVGFLGNPRFTVDVDAMFLASQSEIPKIFRLAKEEGIEPRIANAEEFAKKNRVLLLRHVSTGVTIDISLGALLFEEEVVDRSVLHDAGQLSVRLPTPEDLIILKAVAHRPKDLLDIREVVRNNPNPDVSRIEYWVKYFAGVLETPDLWNEIQQILKSEE